MQDAPHRAPELPEARPAGGPVVARPAPPGSPAAGGGVSGPPGSPLELRELTVGQAGLDLLLILMVGVVEPFLPLLINGWLGLGGGSIGPAPILIAAKWGQAIAAVTLVGYLLAVRGLPPAAFGLRTDRPGSQLARALLTLLAMYGYLIVGATVIVALAALGLLPIVNEVRQRYEFMQQLPQPVGQTVVLMVAVAVHEELLFRGLLVTYLRRVTGRWSVAVLTGSALFAVLHIGQGALAVVQVFGLAIVLSVMFILTRSIFAVMCAHLMFDLIQTAIQRLLPDIERVIEPLQRFG